MSNTYAEYFGAINLLADLLSGDEQPWVRRFDAEERPREVVLYLGCNVLRTMHLALTVIDVFRKAGVDFVPLGGPQSCCGIIHFTGGDEVAAGKIGERTVRNFERFKPSKVVMWCPSCMATFDQRLSKLVRIDVPWEHATEFLAGRLERLPPLRPVRRVVALHRHGGTSQQESDAGHTRRILEAIPGLRVVELASPPELGEHCTSFLRQRLGEARFAEVTADLFRSARAAGADTFGTIYHSCHRELCEFEASLGLEVVNYISILGEAMGIHHEDRYKRFKLSGDIDAILDELRPVARRKGLDEQRVRRVLVSHFAKPGSPPSPA